MKFSQKLGLFFVRMKYQALARLVPRSAARSAFRLFCTPQLRNRKELPPVFQQGEALSFSFEGETVRGFRWNRGAAKKALILHGFESSIVNFDGYVKPLTDKGYEVLAFDAPAHGRSTGHSITVLTYKNMIGHILREYGPVHGFLAHSFGGLSLCLALEEFGSNPQQRVVLIAPAAETVTAIDNFFAFLHLPARLRPYFDQHIYEVGGRPASWYSVSRVAPQLQAQVFFLQDEGDDMTPFRDVEPLMKKELPHFRFHITRGLGHRRIYRDAGVMQRVLEFL